MVYNASADLWFQYFSEDGPQIWILTAAFGARSAWAMLGAVFNMALVYVTVKSKSLHGICNILLAMESFFAGIMDITFLISFFVVISGVRFVPYQYCFPIIIVPGTLFGNCAQLTMVFTGLDRLSSVLFPLWYIKRSNSLSLASVFLILVCFNIYVFIVYYIAYQENLNMMVSCSTIELNSASMAALTSANGYTLSALLMIIYALMWLFVFKMTETAQLVDMANRRLAKSLIVIIGINLVGVFIRNIVLFAFQFVNVSVFTNKGVSIAFSFLTIAAYSANAPVLYSMSGEYRKQFNKHFGWLRKLFNFKNNSVMAIGPAQPTSTHHH